MGMEGFAAIAESFQDLASGKLVRELQIDRNKSQAEASAYERGVEAGKQR